MLLVNRVISIPAAKVRIIFRVRKRIRKNLRIVTKKFTNCHYSCDEIPILGTKKGEGVVVSP